MSDWIDRDEVLEEIEDDASNGVYSCFASYKDAQKFKKIIKSINSRAHGEWIEKQHFFGRCSAECSICGKRTSGQSEETAGGFMYSYTDFCPNCGADMREVQHE